MKLNNSDLLNLSLEQIASAIGDPTEPVFTLLYQRHPELAAFSREDTSWQHYMIQEILQNLMEMAENPDTALAIIRDMTLHHQMIGLEADTFKGMYRTLHDVVVQHLSGPHREDMTALWEDSVQRICRSVDSAF
ncbi:MAG: hypothetical protein CMK89_07570 [Pseudomonadales bacterium]|nr:hypothetical protein [Pseudomonadales bacterium]